MERFGDQPEKVTGPEREPQPHDVAAAVHEALRALAPDADAEDVKIALAEIEAAVDLEEALGAAAGAFAMLDVEGDLGLLRVGEILQVEAILPNGDQEQD